jgi:PAS domain S-box-containing protein
LKNFSHPTDTLIFRDRLSLQEKQYNTIIENFQLGLLEVDLNGLIIGANSSFSLMSGYSIEELIGKQAEDLLLTDENRSEMEEINRLRQSGESHSYELSVKTKQNEKRWWRISGAPRWNELGQEVGSIGIHYDITRQKNLELALTEDKKRAEVLADLKTQFLANMSHEIRTPLNAVIGMIRELQIISNSPEQKEFLHIADIASEALLNVINDVLDYSKLEAGRIKLESISFNPKLVIENTLKIIHEQIQEKQLKVTTLGLDKFDHLFKGDPSRFQQCILNILSNAVKFTHVGGITVWTDCIYSNSNQTANLHLQIEDTGVGMDKKSLSEVFEKFVQADNSTSRKYGGTGLGLSITQSLIHLMGGNIQLISEKHKGTKVIIDIPMEVADQKKVLEQESPSPITHEFQNYRILSVEDNALNRAVIKAYLNRYHIQLAEAKDGLEALEILDHDSFDLILLDIQMPNLDGIEFCKIIRQRGNSTPVVALTANAQLSEKEKCLQAGMNDYLIKPFVETEMMQALHKYYPDPSKLMPPSDIKYTVQQFNNQEISNDYFLDRIQELVGTDEQVISNIIHLFIKEGSRIAQELESAINNNDVLTVRAKLHELRPNLFNMGMDAAFETLNLFRSQINNNVFNPGAEQIGIKLIAIMRNTIEKMKIDFNY